MSNLSGSHSNGDLTSLCRKQAVILADIVDMLSHGNANGALAAARSATLPPLPTCSRPPRSVALRSLDAPSYACLSMGDIAVLLSRIVDNSSTN